MEFLVKIIIPIYKTNISPLEQISLKRCQEILSKYPLVIVKPESLDIKPILSLLQEGVEVESFPDKFFKGIAGYNEFMLSPDFYGRFLDVKYILIYQLDAYVFRDELEMWCEREYDYIGAPWLRKKKYHKWYNTLYWGGRKALCRALGVRSYHDSFDKVGNGGFSLRKVESHYLITREMRSTIEEYLQKSRNKRFNEDAFWALEVPRKYPHFRIPQWKEALQFSFDVQVPECFYYSHNKLPFGIHGWIERLRYYQNYIEEL